MTSTIALTPNQEYQARRSLISPIERDHYTLSGAWLFESSLSVEPLRNAVESLVAMHPLLSVTLESCGRLLRHEERSPTSIIELVEVDDACFEDEQIRKTIYRLSTPLQIQAGRLWQIQVFLSSRRTLVLLRVSHIVCDRTSWRILLEDFENAYHGGAPTTSASLEDYGHLAERLRSAQTALASKNLQDRVQQLGKVGWPNRLEMTEHEAESYETLATPVPLTGKALEDVARVHRTTVLMLLLSALRLGASALGIDRPLAVAVPIGIRMGRQFSRCLGDFTNLAVLGLDEACADPRGCRVELARAVSWSSIHVMQLSRLLGVEDVARVRVELSEPKAGQGLTLGGQTGLEVSGRTTTRRDLSIALAIGSQEPPLLSVSRRSSYGGVESAALLSAISAGLVELSSREPSSVS